MLARLSIQTAFKRRQIAYNTLYVACAGRMWGAGGIQPEAGAPVVDLDKEKVVKLVIVLLVTIAALAVMSIMVQVIQTILPFLIVGAGIYAGYRWALSEAPAPTADEVEEQARGIFSRFRRTKKAIETTAKVGEALADFGAQSERPIEKKNERKHRRRRPLGTVPKDESAQAETAEAADETVELSDDEVEAIKEQQASQMKQALGDSQGGKIEFKDSDVVINAKDIKQPDISRLEEKEKEEPEVTKNVLAQIEERRRRLQGD
ncbi:MAG: hypothetical protein OXG85_00630 [Chloroflexi bacterium]|nr:hypothetical protein [Chloroflexota bacterium]